MTWRDIFPNHQHTAQSFPGLLLDGVLNLLYPEACVSCSAPVQRRADRGLCGVCWGRLLQLKLKPPWCPACGLPQPQLPTDEARLCIPCLTQAPPFTAARSFGYYCSELSRVVQALKFRGRRNLAARLAPLLAGLFFETWSPADFDLVVPVPLSGRRRRERGYNQAALLAAPLARTAGLRCDESVLLRVRHTVPQVGLMDSARRLNPRGAFVSPGGAGIRRMRILLIDDVMTTGATAASAAEALKGAGALRVCVLTLARTAPGGM